MNIKLDPAFAGMEIMTDPIAELLGRGVEEVIDHEHLEQQLRSKKKLRVKLGIDPTSPNIHIGRAVLLLKLRAFQDAGHRAIFIVGDSTGLVGDTSDKESERPMLTEKQVEANMKTYFDQAYKILDKKKTEVHYNSKWLNKLGFFELAKMANLYGLHEIESREIIAKRLKTGQRVSLHEAMYPLLQGYDSVAVKADLELGGTDQRFNLLAGRRIQPMYNQEPQDILMMGILEGTDGRKMSSSWGNVINVTDEPNDMFGRVMSINDELIKKYFVLATRVPLEKISEIIHGNANPRDQKLELAWNITELYYGAKKADAAKEAFISQFSKGELPNDIPTKKITPNSYRPSDLVFAAGLASSKSEARRFIEQGGVKFNDQVVKDDSKLWEIKGDDDLLIQVGKRKFIRIT